MVEPGQRRPLAPEAGIEATRPGLAVETGADHHHVRALPHQGGVVEPPLRHRTGGEVLRHHVHPEREPTRDRHALGTREVERDRQLVRVQHREVMRTVEPARRVGCQPEDAEKVGSLPRLDADHRGTVVGEVAGGDRSGRTAAELEDGRAGEEPRHTMPSARRRATSAAPMPSSASTSTVCSPSSGAGRGTPIRVPSASAEVVIAKAPG